MPITGFFFFPPRLGGVIGAGKLATQGTIDERRLGGSRGGLSHCGIEYLRERGSLELKEFGASAHFPLCGEEWAVQLAEVEVDLDYCRVFSIDDPRN